MRVNNKQSKWWPAKWDITELGTVSFLHKEDGYRIAILHHMDVENTNRILAKLVFEIHKADELFIASYPLPLLEGCGRPYLEHFLKYGKPIRIGIKLDGDNAQARFLLNGVEKPFWLATAEIILDL